MVKEGVLKNPDVDVMMGLHINSQTPVGVIGYKSGGTLAAADRWVMTINGKQSHGSAPWSGADPIVAAAQLINGIQTIISRNTELTKEAAVISAGLIRFLPSCPSSWFHPHLTGFTLPFLKTLVA